MYFGEVMNVVIYARYSSDAQRDASIEQQVKACRQFCERMQYTVIDVYSDRAMTGRTDMRPSFQQMIKDSKSRRFSAVVVYALDRFSRDRYDSAVYKRELKLNGVKVISACENIADDPSGILFESILEGLAEYYSAELSRKIHRGNDDNASKFLAPGSVPLGYNRSPDGHYIINETEADIVREIFQRVADGETFANVFRNLNERGIKTKKGAVWNRSSFNHIITNERYIGTFIYKDSRTQDAIPAIVEKELYWKVQGMIQNKPNPRGKRRATDNALYLLTGLMFCECGELCTGVSGTSKSGKKHRYYTCHKRCHYLNADRMELTIANAIRELVMDDDCIKWMAHNAVKFASEGRTQSDREIVAGQLKEATKRKNNVMTAILQGIITETTKEALEQAERDEKIYAAKLAEIEKACKEQVTEDDVISFLELYRESEIERDFIQQGIIDAFVRRVDLAGDIMRITFTLPGTKENQQADLPLADLGGGCSYKPTKWR